MKTSGLNELRREAARQSCMRAVHACIQSPNREDLHYTEGSQRWQPINFRVAGWRGETPNYADCSSFATWAEWCGLHPFGVKDIVNGQRWRAGFTGSMVDHGIHVTHGMEKRADLAFYGDPLGDTGHVAVCVGGAKVISFGSEDGPYLLDIDYRDDYLTSRRYI